MSSYIKDLSERVITGFATGTLSVLGTERLNVLEADWPQALGVGAGGAVLALLVSLAARGVGDKDRAGLTS